MIKFDEYGNLADIDGQYSNLHLKHVIHGYAKNDRPEEGVLLVFTDESYRDKLHVMEVYQWKGNTIMEWLSADSHEEVLANVMKQLLGGGFNYVRRSYGEG
jgi:hypothetical protein